VKKPILLAAVPPAPAAIPALKAEILRRFEADSRIVQDDAKEDKAADPQGFQPYSYDSAWRVAFDSPRVIAAAPQALGHYALTYAKARPGRTASCCSGARARPGPM
jgi:hypothetical protein